MKIGYFSSSDRGLDTALEIFALVKEQIPEAEFVWAYGWQTFDAYHAKNPEKMKWKWSVIRRMNELGAVSAGRLSHEELAKLMKECKVWLYPTEFTEIHCITALKAQEAGCIPVTTGIYALEETVKDNTYTVKCYDIASNKEKQAEMAEKCVEALRSDHKPTPVEGVDWSDVAVVWKEAMA